MADGVLPNQGIYQQRKAEAEAAYQRALAALSAQRGSILQDFGFRGVFGEDGSLESYEVDPTNEYGSLQMLRGQQSLQLDDASEEARLRGFAGSGFGAQAEDRLRYAQGYDTFRLGQDFLGSVTGLAEAQRDALSERNSAFLGIEQDQLYEALQNRLFNDPPAPEEKDLTKFATASFKGKDYTKQGLIRELRERGRTVGSWAWRNPEKAKTLGIKVPGKKPVWNLKESRRLRKIDKLSDWQRRKRKSGMSRQEIKTRPAWVKLQKLKKAQSKTERRRNRRRRRRRRIRELRENMPLGPR